MRLLYLCLAMFGVACAKVRLDYQYQVDVPLAGVRFHVRHVLQRFLLNLQVDALDAKLNRKVANKHAACRLTPGAAVQLLDPLVFEAVNHIWGFVFEVPQVVAGLLASFVAGYVTRKYYGLVIPLLCASPGPRPPPQPQPPPHPALSPTPSPTYSPNPSPDLSPPRPLALFSGTSAPP